LRRLSMGTRDELVEAVSARYREASRAEKWRILMEFVAVSGYCRKHAGRLLRRVERPARSAPLLSRRRYDDAVHEASGSIETFASPCSTHNCKCFSHKNH
jgi:hypothetical protein